MCGLVGMIGDVEAKHRLRFRDMLDVCQLRGRDSTGVVNVKRTGEYVSAKALGPPSYLIDTLQYDRKIDVGFHKGLIGHCRHKTIGAVSIKNAHPFDIEEAGIIGVHNGTLKNERTLDGYEAGMVDSQALYLHLAQNGPENTFDRITGAWACVWYDSNDETFNFIRNDERPLWFTRSKDCKVLLWASELWMLYAAERKMDFWEGPEDEPEKKYFRLPVNTLWSFKVNNYKLNGPPIIEQVECKGIEPKKAQATHQTAWQQNRSMGSTTTTTTATNKGGEGAIPFPSQSQHSQNPPSEGQKEESQDENDSTSSCIPPSMEGLARHLGMSKLGTVISNGSDKKTSSLPANSTKNRTESNEDISTGLLKQVRTSTSSMSPVSQRPKEGVSVRYPAGLPHVTDNKTGTEYSLAQVEENTGGCCTFCDHEISDVKEIVEFLGKDKFICTDCTTPPKPLLVVSN